MIWNLPQEHLLQLHKKYVNVIHWYQLGLIAILKSEGTATRQPIEDDADLDKETVSHMLYTTSAFTHRHVLGGKHDHLNNKREIERWWNCPIHSSVHNILDDKTPTTPMGVWFGKFL